MTDTLHIDPHPGGADLAVRVIPRAGRSEIAGVRAGALLVRLAAAPVDGAANAALIALLAERLGVARSQLALIAGERRRDKRVRIFGLPVDVVAERLQASTAGRLRPRP